MNTYMQEKLDNKFWDDMAAQVDWSPSFITELFEEEQILRDCPATFKSIAESYRDYYLTNSMLKYDPENLSLVVYEDISSCATPNNDKYKVGWLNSHIVETTINGFPYLMELPEVQVSVDATPYLSHLEAVASIKTATKIDTGYRQSLMRSLSYCHRLNTPVAPLFQHAYNQGYKANDLERMHKRAIGAADRMRTVDYWLADWAEKALALCNTVVQCQIIKHVYIKGATYNSKQPRICKKTIAAELGCNRNVIIRLFKRLEKAGLMVQRELTFKYDYNRMAPRTDARIVNLDPSEPNRWENYKQERTFTISTSDSSSPHVPIVDISSCATPVITDDMKRRYSGEWSRSNSKLTLTEYVQEQIDLEDELDW